MCKSSDFKDWVCMEYFKIFFEISKGKVHIAKVGYYIDNAGEITDLD